jgi:hypothetical protein
MRYVSEVGIRERLEYKSLDKSNTDEVLKFAHLSGKWREADVYFNRIDKLIKITAHDIHPTKVANSIASKVSDYAKHDPSEFVAETFSGLVYGKKYDEDVMDAYVKYGGVLPKGGETK